MANVYEHIIPDIDQWPVTKISHRREQFIEELNKFVLDKLLESHGENINDLISKTIYLEKQRIKLNPWKVDPADDKQYWSDIAKTLEISQSREDKRDAEIELLGRIVNRYSQEIVGHFVKGTFKFSRFFLTSFFKRLFCKYFGTGQWRWGSKRGLQDKIKLTGDAELIRSLFTKGVVIILPTHYSNLDSIMVGYAIDSNLGLPAFSYGAGLNLYNVELVAYFMNRLGAFRVDRRKKNPIYLECIKGMSCYSLTQDVNNIFFPGGTRSRNGATETKVKLGLLNSVIEAQRINLLKEDKKKIFIVTLNIGYHFVLEGKELIDQHLRHVGRDKYVSAKNIKLSGASLWRFVKDLYKKESEVYMSLGNVIDVFGNQVDKNGMSFDKFGNEVDIEDYFKIDQKIVANSQRESIYTKLLGETVVQQFKKHNVVLSSNIVSFVAFQLFRKNNADIDLISFLQMKSDNFELCYEDFKEKCSVLVNEVKKMNHVHQLRISDILNSPIDNIIEDGLLNLGIYHSEKVLRQDNDKIKTGDLRLLYFYHNRLINYTFNESFDWVEAIENV